MHALLLLLLHLLLLPLLHLLMMQQRQASILVCCSSSQGFFGCSFGFGASVLEPNLGSKRCVQLSVTGARFATVSDSRTHLHCSGRHF